MKSSILCLGLLLLCCSCQKTIDDLIEKASTKGNSSTSDFITYSIKKGANYCDQSIYKPVALSELKFVVKFDSTAIYQTSDPGNQYDINKLYGFSDNELDHHQFSARFGWRWSDQALRLFAYVYNNASWTEQEIGAIVIGKEVICSIKVAGDSYVFIMDDKQVIMPRKSTTPLGKGYQLYPYFGGDETAPHDIKILIKDISQ